MSRKGLPTEVRRGFTLIEIIVAVVIAAMMALVVGFVVNAGMEGWFFMKGQRAITMEARGVMKRMVREIRKTKGDAESVIIFTPTRYKFEDIDSNIIDYQKNGSNLERNGVVLLRNLASSGGLEFVYLDASGDAATLEENIRTIRITILVEEGDNRVRLRSAASIRNR